MKKLMIAAAIVCAAAFAQAGTVKWDSGDIMGVGEGGLFTTSLIADDVAVGTLFMLTEDQWSGYYNEGKDYAATAKAIYDDYKAGNLTGGITGKSSDGAIVLSDNKSYTAGTDVYAALIYETTADGKDWYIANLGDYSAKSANKSVLDFAVTEFGDGNSGTSNNLTGWTAAAVPEPTSGLLLLLGVAGLALRRRRA